MEEQSHECINVDELFMASSAMADHGAIKPNEENIRKHQYEQNDLTESLYRDVLRKSHDNPTVSESTQKESMDNIQMTVGCYTNARKRKPYCKFNKIDEEIYKYSTDRKAMKSEPEEIPIDVLPHKHFGRHWHGGCHRFKKLKKPRTAISFRTKLEIISYAELNPAMKQADIADIFGIDRTAVTKILKRKTEFKGFRDHGKQYGEANSLHRRVPHNISHVEIALNNWYCKTVQENKAIEVSDQLVKERAVEIAKVFGVSGFQATNDWIENFYQHFHLFRSQYNYHTAREEMAGFDRNNYDDNDWHPPTAAEEKVLKAKRERSNKISELMGQKLLLGWKMLADACDTCNTVMLQDREGQRLCVACNELDSDNQKDDPAVNPAAAQSQIQEHVGGDGSHTGVSNIPTPELSNSHILENNGRERNIVGDGDTSGFTSCTAPTVTINAVDTLDVLVDKVKWATDALRATQCITTSTRLCNLIKAAADAIVSVKAIHLDK